MQKTLAKICFAHLYIVKISSIFFFFINQLFLLNFFINSEYRLYSILIRTVFYHIIYSQNYLSWKTTFLLFIKFGPIKYYMILLE